MIKKIKIENMTSPRTGAEVPNQFIITTEEGEYFQSYRSIIAFIPKDNSGIILDASKWDYSRTTSKYRNDFLNETTKETEEKIKTGEYKLLDLNN
jgi:hypothetical protein